MLSIRSIIGLKEKDPNESKVEYYLREIEGLKQTEVKPMEKVWLANGKCKNSKECNKVSTETLIKRFSSCELDCKINLCPECLKERLKLNKEPVCFSCFADLDPAAYQELCK